MSLTQRVKVLCEQYGVTLSGLSKQLGFSKNALYNWDTNAPSTDKIQKVAEYFDVSVDYLLGLTDDSRPRRKGEVVLHDVTDDERAAIKAFLKAYREQKNTN